MIRAVENPPHEDVMARAKPDPGPQFTTRVAAGHFARDLRAADKSPRTIETYLAAVEHFATFAEGQGSPAVADIDVQLVRSWILAMLDAGNSDGTRFNRYNGLKAFLKWAVIERLLAANPMGTIPPPKPQAKPVAVLTTAQLEALLK